MSSIWRLGFFWPIGAGCLCIQETYMAGVDELSIVEILNLWNSPLGTTPVRYVGCSPLVDKMGSQILELGK